MLAYKSRQSSGDSSLNAEYDKLKSTEGSHGHICWSENFGCLDYETGSLVSKVLGGKVSTWV